MTAFEKLYEALTHCSAELVVVLRIRSLLVPDCTLEVSLILKLGVWLLFLVQGLVVHHAFAADVVALEVQPIQCRSLSQCDDGCLAKECF
jgi:hypothetical protein